jgi:hypothetical protein
MEIHEYLTNVAAQLVHELQPVLQIKEVTSNSELLGMYAEASLRRLVQRVVHPMRVSTGAVLDYPMPDQLRQIDIVIWAPFPAPAVFEVEDFALVPRSSAFGLIEVKRSNHSSVDTALEKFVDEEAATIVAESDAKIGDSRTAGMGVISILENTPSSRLQSLMAQNKVIALFNKYGSQVEVRSKDVLVFINFLQYVRWRYHFRTAQQWIPQVDTRSL